MPPKLALIFCIAFVGVLIYWDVRSNPRVSNALWIPLIWISLLSSRPLSIWLSGELSIYDSTAEASSVDKNFIFLVIVIAVVIIFKRKISISQVVRYNIPLLLFLSFAALSISWSEYPFVSFKRWIKDAGNVIMVLVVYTSEDWVASLKSLLKRFSMILLPFSVLLIKYYPHLGRNFSPWSGQMTYAGIATNKNLLGFSCVFTGVFLIWILLFDQDNKISGNARLDRYLVYFLISLDIWLISILDSMTSLMCLIAGVGILILIRMLQKSNYSNSALNKIILIITIMIVFLGLTTNFLQMMIGGLGRDLTLTGRLDLWKEVVIVMDSSPFLGVGYESFWTGERLEYFWSEYWWLPNQAHNGYLETYLNLGLIGTSLLIILLFSSYKKAIKQCIIGLEFGLGSLRVSFIIIAIIYGITEAVFKGMHTVWFAFILLNIQYAQNEELECSRGQNF